ncbi:MAG: hypothetical protein WBP59_10085 [Ilumatobacteraceae bacterium]
MIRLFAATVSIVALLTACSSSGDPDPADDPGIGGINGPAQVDPSYDPFDVEPSATTAPDADG